MKRPSKKTVIIASALAACIAAGAGLLGTRDKNVVRPRTGPIVEAVYALGTVKSHYTFNLKMGVLSIIKNVSIKEGQTVHKGQFLLSNDSGADFFAPFSGTVTRLYSEEGEIVSPGVPVLTLMDLGKRYIQVSLDQQSAIRLKKGQKAEISVETMRGKKLSGVVETIYPSSGQFLAKISVAGMPDEVLPDMTADVAIEVARRDRALLVPLAAVRDGALSVIRGGKKITVRPKIGAIDGAWGEILDNGVLPADEILKNE